MLNIRSWGLGLVLLAVAACATPERVPFEYEQPVARLNEGSTYVLIVEPIQDARYGDRSLDKVLSESPCACVTAAMEQEMRATGLFAEVVRASDADRTAQLVQSPDKKHLRVKARLLDMAWDVTGYGNIQNMRTVSVVGFGVVGAIARNAYETSTLTPVNGRTALAIELTDSELQQPLLKKTYTGMASESRKISECDSWQTRSHMVSRSTADAMRQFKTDLVGLLQNPPQPAAM
jgi:hypothetical protein